MVRTRVVALALTTLVACKGDKQEDKPAPAGSGSAATPAGSGSAATPAPTPAGPPSKTNATSADLGMLPVDSELVMGLQFGELAGSLLWKELVAPQIAGNAELTARLAEIKAKCDIDLLASIQTLTAGVKLGADKASGVLVVHGLPKAKVGPCMDKVKTESGGKAEVARDGDVTLVTSSGETVGFTHVGDARAVVVFGAGTDAAKVKAAAAGTSTLPQAKGFLDLYNGLDTGDTAWMVMNGSSQAFEVFDQLGMRPKAMFGSVSVRDGARADLRFRMASPDQATQLASVVKQQVAGMLGMIGIESFEVATANADVQNKLAVPAAKLPGVIEKVKGLLGGGR